LAGLKVGGTAGEGTKSTFVAKFRRAFAIVPDAAHR